MRMSGNKGGMQTSSTNSSYCPVCNQNMLYITDDGLVKHWTKKGTILYCSVKHNIKRKREKQIIKLIEE